MRKISRMAVLIPGGLLAAAVFVSGCTSLAGQSASTPPGPAAGVASAGGTASSETGAGADVIASNRYTVDIAVDLEFAKDNGDWMVFYVEGKWDDSSMAAPRPVSAGGPTQVVALAPDVELLSPFEGATPTAEPQLDSEGLGVVPITLDDFIQQDNQSAKIWFDESGQVIKIAARYQP